MSKYDDFNYLTRREKEEFNFPKCIENTKYSPDFKIPEDLLGLSVDQLKSILQLNSDEDIKTFNFVNNGQTMITANYLKRGRFFSEKMSPDEKKEFLLDYMNSLFGNKVDGNYFERNLQDIYRLGEYELIDEDFDVMIKEYFKKSVVDLEDVEDRKNFKEIIFHDKIHLVDKDTFAKEINEKQRFSTIQEED